METQSTTQPHLADYLRPLRTRTWLILFAVILATGGVYAYYARKANIYTTSTLVYVKDPGDPVTGVPNTQSTDRQVQDQATLLYARSTAATVAGQIAYRGTPQDLLKRVSITSKPGEDFVDVTAQGSSARQAARIANAFGAELATLVNDAATTRIQNAIQLSKSELSQLPPGPPSLTARAELSDQLNRLELAQRVPTTIARQVEQAQPPGGPSSPKPVRNALFAFVLSLALAIGAAYGAERFDRRLKSPDEMEDAYHGPLLAVLPHADDPAPVRAGEAMLNTEFREPFRVLRTNVELASLDRPPRTIVVSSAMPGEGKSTVVRNLALAFRETGRSVAVVDLDLRHPTLARMFGVPQGPGMTEVLRHEADLDQVTLRIGAALPALDEFILQPAAHWRSNGHEGKVTHSNGIGLILSGTRPANPPAVLASERLVEVLDELRERNDVVLIDSAPVLAVTDTVPLLRYADAALFVGRLGITTRDTVKRLTEFLARVPGVNLLGVIANDLSRMEAGAYGYGYGAYRDEPQQTPANAEVATEQQLAEKV